MNIAATTSDHIKHDIIIKNLGTVAYETSWKAMQDFTNNRDEHTLDEIWVVEHPPVFTQGQAGKQEHILNTNHNIPIIQSDRGGQVTYHGPGQLVVYLLLDLRRRGLKIRQLVTNIEQAIIDTLAQLDINSYSDPCAPGVYVDIDNQKHKICSIGLRVKKGCSYHGIALNYKMDLTPFSYINPCGFNKLKVTQVTNLNHKYLNDNYKVKIINLLSNNLIKNITCK